MDYVLAILLAATLVFIFLGFWLGIRNRYPSGRRGEGRIGAASATAAPPDAAGHRGADTRPDETLDNTRSMEGRSPKAPPLHRDPLD